MDKIKVNLVGFGVMGRNHFRILLKLEQCHLSAVCDIETKNREEVEKYCAFYTDLEEMLEKEKPDALVIATQPQDTINVINRSIAKVRNFLVEKPLATLRQIDEAEKLLEKAKRDKIRIMVGETTCYDPATIAIKKNLKLLGEIKTIISIRSGKYPFRFLHVGVNEDLLTHDLSFARYLLDWDIFEIKNTIKASIFRNAQLDFITIDSVSKKGTRFIAISSWLTEEKIRVSTILGDKGVAQINFLDENKYVRILPPEVINEIRYGSIEEFRRLERERYKIAVELELEKREALEIELNHFLDCVRRNENPITNIERAVENLRILKSTENN